MKTPLSWIKEYVPALQCTDEEYNSRMTMTGTKVDGMYRLDKNLEKIVVGRIEKIERHPDADKLVVCQVDIGEEVTQIVTGASNVFEGALVPVVLGGGRVAGGHDGGPLPENGIKIKAGKLRGVESNGMMCSVEELGTDANAFPDAPENGIYILPEQYGPVSEKSTEMIPVKPGMDALDVMGLHEPVFEYEITSNRVDCYSVLGVAREAAVTFGVPYVPPVPAVKNESGDVNDYVSIEVKDPDLCSRYTARVCTDIKIGPSPYWMQRRLANSGVRPINNLVDITNYVMLEYGQPMHAFDLDTVAGHKIIVRRAKDGDEFQTLDGQMRKMDRDVLMICDAEKEIGIAGIMGGENSKITDDVKTVLFESATFNGPNVRKSAKRIGLRTDASGIFEKGLDPNNAEAAINRACQLMEELGCGKVVAGMADVCEPIPAPVRIPFSAEKINAFLGTDYSKETMLSIFEKLELAYDGASNEVIVPSFRQDVKGMCDLAEEVARFTGYDNIPDTLPASSATMGGLTYKMRIEDKARETAQQCGFSEAMTFSFESPKVMDKLLFDADAPERRGIRIQNPLGEDFSMMRTTPLNGMLNSLSTNYNRRNKNVRLFELANVYIAKALPLTELPDERSMFTLGMYGDGDFFTMKGVIELFFESVGMKKKMVCDPASGKPFLHPGRQANIVYDGTVMGYIGEVHPDVLSAYGIGDRAVIAVLDMNEVVPVTTFDFRYEGIAKYPAVSRDISMLVPVSVTAGQIEAVIEQRGGKILESYRLFDIYEGAQIKAGFKSIAYNLTFRNKEKTLEESEVTAAMKKVLNGLAGLDIELRS
ncbi:MAG: phenylalanine--tRNA ligase subunit beta [Lachnospiraceae bacterium]|nr:phenylalanine--tRNA ligase subunit beta [Lachnospiraceae bacterium]